jgi:phosphotransferase system HPr (HPr) family protein
MTECSYTITDPLGIHARPAGLFVKKLQEFSSDITITKNGININGKKLLALMKLQARQNETIFIRAQGEDEQAAIEAARQFLSQSL